MVKKQEVLNGTYNIIELTTLTRSLKLRGARRMVSCSSFYFNSVHNSRFITNTEDGVGIACEHTAIFICIRKTKV